MKKLPSVTVASLLVPCLFYLAITFFYEADEKLVMTAGIVAVAVSLMLLTFIFTLAIGCWVVIVMKGPVRTADSYPLIDAERPHRREKDKGSFEP